MTHDQALFAAIAGVAALGLSLAGVPLSRVVARRFGVLDPPGPRKIHTAPMPRMGGLGVFLAFSTVVLTGYLMLPYLRGSALAGTFTHALELLKSAERVESKLLAVLGGSAVAFTVGLVDDILGPRMPVMLKAAGQLVAALVLIAADVKTSFLPAEWMNVALTLVWLVGITNSFNLLDNMDGLASGVALVAASVLLLNAWLLGEFFISLLLVTFIGSLLGFLRFNFYPASVFLGDCGSLFIGYLLGSLTLLERYVSNASSSLFPVLMPVFVLAIPILDTTTVVAIRLRERRPIYVGDTRHLSHRLVSLGFTPRASVLFIYMATFCLGLGAALLPHASRVQTLMIVCQSLSFVALFMALLFFERRRSPR